MRVYKIVRLYTFFTIALLLLATHAFGVEGSFSDPNLPKGLVMEEGFKPGLGGPIGKVLLAQGDVVIIHDKTMTGYLAEKDRSLFKNDSIITLDKGRIRFELNDGSVMTLASKTNMKLNQSIYEPQKKSRLSFLKLNLGKARFLVQKMAGFSRSDFKVKTPTAVAGVRGSDFVINATEDTTQVTTLDETQLEVVSDAYPEEPVMMDAFEKSTIEAGAQATDPEPVSPEEAEAATQDFVFDSGPALPADVGVTKEKKEGTTEGTSEKGSADEGAAGVQVAEPEGVLVDENDLVDPDTIAGGDEEAPDLGFEDVDVEQDQNIQEGAVADIVEQIEETIPELPVDEEMPDFPGYPTGG